MQCSSTSGGHSDLGHRYHYHTIPLCVLREMGATVPSSGVNYLFKENVNDQIAEWPSKSDPSPFLGLARDGFPIYGPYNVDGILQLGASAGSDATLSNCNFDFASQRYHLTPNAPYVPDCWVGDSIGTFQSQIRADVCPMKGLTNSYCSGPSCVITPPATPCDVFNSDFSLQYFFMGVGLVLAAFFFCHTILFSRNNSSRVQSYMGVSVHGPFTNDVVGNETPKKTRCSDGKSLNEVDENIENASRTYTRPIMRVASATWTSVLLLGINPYIQNFYYGDDAEAGIVAENLNTTAQSLLAVLGVVYGLIVAQFLSISSARLDIIRASLAAEIAGLTRICQVIAGIKSKDDAKRKLLELVAPFADDINEVFDNPRAFSSYDSLGEFSEISPLITELLSASDDAASEFSIRALDMTDDIVNSITLARCKLLYPG